MGKQQWFSRQTRLLPLRWSMLQRSSDSQPMVAMRSVTRPARRDGTSLQESLRSAADTCRRLQMESVHSQQQHDPMPPLHPSSPAPATLTEHHQCRRVREGLSVYIVTRQPYTFCSASKEETAHASCTRKSSEPCILCQQCIYASKFA